LSEPRDNRGLEQELDRLLTQRVRESSKLPWLDMRVEHQVEALQQARTWLRHNPGGLLAASRPALYGLQNPRALLIAGAGACGALVGYWLAQLGGLSVPWLDSLAPAASALCAVLAIAAVQMQQSGLTRLD
jgi:hypothetical protein